MYQTHDEFEIGIKYPRLKVTVTADGGPPNREYVRQKIEEHIQSLEFFVPNDMIHVKLELVE